MFIQLNFLLTNVFIATFVNNIWIKQQTILIRIRDLYWLKIKFRIFVYRGHPHSTYAQKSPKLDPPSPLGLTSLYAYVLSIYSLPPPPSLLIKFYSHSSFRHSQFLDYFDFYLSLRLIFTKPISNKKKKKSFTKKKSFEILWSKKNFFAYVRNLETPLPPCTQSYALGLTPPFPLCAYVLCGWPHNILNIFFKNFFTLHT